MRNLILLTALLSLGSCTSKFNRDDDLDPSSNPLLSSGAGSTNTSSSSFAWNHRISVTGYSANQEGKSISKSETAVASNGDAINVWKQSPSLTTPGNNRLYYSTLDSDTNTWTMPDSLAEFVTIDTNAGLTNFKTAINAVGEIIIIWLQSDGSTTQLYKSERSSAGVWTYPTSLTDHLSVAGTSVSNIDVSMNDNGIIIVSWTQSDGSNSQIFKAEKSALGAWTVPANLADNISPDGQNGTGSTNAINNNNLAIITWWQVDGSNSQVYKAERSALGAWTLPANLADNISPDGQPATTTNTLKSVAMNENNEAIIVWMQSDGTYTGQIFKAERASNGTWTTPANLTDNISPDSNNTAIIASVSMNSNSEAIVTWLQSDGSNDQTFKAERASNGTWTLPANINDNISPNGSNVSNISNTIDSNGRILITWEQSNGTNKQIYKAERILGVWTLPANINDNVSVDGVDATVPSLLTNSTGYAAIFWLQSNMQTVQFIAERATNGAWTIPSNITDTNTVKGFLSYPTKSILSSNGTAITIWSTVTSGHQGLFKSERNAAGVWSKPATDLDYISLGANLISNYDAAINANGEAVIAWIETDGTNDQVFKAERASNGVWTYPANASDNISPNGTNAASYLSVAINNLGESIITWKQNDGATEQIYKAERSTSGLWTVPANAADHISPSNQNAAYPRAAINSNGIGIITWQQFDGAFTQIYMSERAANGTWTNPANLADNISPDGTNASTPEVVLNSNNQAVISWYQNDGAFNQIFKSERAANGTWINPANLADNISPDNYAVLYFKSAMNSSGQAILTWQATDGTYNYIYKAERAANGTWTLPANLLDYISFNASDATNPNVDLNSNGEAIINWYQSDGLRNQIFVATRNNSGIWSLPTTNDGIFTSTKRATPVSSYYRNNNISYLDSGEILFSYITYSHGACVSEYRP